MLQMLRGKKSGLFVKIALVLITIGFSFFGIESYFVARMDNGVAKVGDIEVTQEEFRERFNQHRQRLVQMTNGQIDASYFENPEIREQVLKQLVDEKLLLAANEEFGIIVAPQRVRAEILAIPAFQVDGVFNAEQYRMALQSNGLSPLGFEERVRQDLGMRELPTQVGATAVVTAADVDEYLRLRDQQRDFSVVRLDRPAPSNAEVTEEDINAYYAAHSDQFMVPEQVSLQYVELDASALEIDQTPDDSVLKDRYEKEKARFVTSEQREAAHILVKVEGSGSPDDQRAALAKAQAIEKQIRDGGDFAEIAKQNSADLGSRNLGGELGWIERGTTDEAFESALFGLAAKGDVSAPVLGGEGYHIIQLRDLRPGKTRTFEEVRPELAKEYTDGERERAWSEKAGRLTDLAYEDPSSLETAAKELGVAVKTTPLFSREGAADGILANRGVVQAAFSDAVLVQNTNSEVIDLGGNHVVVVRLAEHKPAKPMPLDEVRDRVRESVLGERVEREAKQRAERLFAELAAGKALADVATQAAVEVQQHKGIGRQAAGLDSQLVEAVFRMPHPQGAPVDKLVELGGDSYALVRLEAVKDGAVAGLDEKTREAARNTLQQQFAATASSEFVQALRSEIKVTQSLAKLDEL
jgi:peptidyl-prolyl cis-trans isomerase D